MIHRVKDKNFVKLEGFTTSETQLHEKQSEYDILEYPDGVSIYTPHSALTYRTGEFLKNPERYLIELFIEEHKEIRGLEVMENNALTNLNKGFDGEREIENGFKVYPELGKFDVFCRRMKYRLQNWGSMGDELFRRGEADVENVRHYNKITDTIMKGSDDLDVILREHETPSLKQGIEEHRLQTKKILQQYTSLARYSHKSAELSLRLMKLFYPEDEEEKQHL